ncbi:zinc carboxypeptidase [Tamaricihabitans halophyticus]|uniref:Zinc carboxypeptidase n=1 Tax=Tamaricihabitans halophyticus TaxID=1262583 RepID=A0A4R2R0C9_9PSEU|nr:M14 family zinc carboxypeptidase [Tamaricihabitans halophyticus]TCP56072.1 zinc carboxypeptidase [Tamaricihabitans halophyticus]
MSTRRRHKALAIATALLIAGGLGALTPAAAGQQATPEADGPGIYRVHDAADRADELQGAGFDLVEDRAGDDLFVVGDAAESDRLRRAGFANSLEETVRAPGGGQRANNQDTYYGGYHTPAAQYAHLDEVAAAHPELTKLETYGESWRKTTGNGGHDLRAICITKLAEGDCARDPNAPKPRFFLMAQAHAREIATGEVAYQWIDHLVNSYGSDDAITKLLDTTEIWVVPVANPDGVDIVAQGGDNPVLHRKNANDTNGADCTGGENSQIGIDLNRNNDSYWGESGVSQNPCDQTYLGPKANSEVENTALQGLLTDLYPDKRDDGDSAAAPADTTGVFITLHSVAGMVLFPWGHDSAVQTGNDEGLRRLGGELGDILGYQSGQPGELLYDASGAHEDWLYDKLGVPGFTIELGDVDSGSCNGFLPEYSCATDYYWPQFKPALLHAAQRAAAPYQAPSEQR